MIVPVHQHNYNEDSTGRKLRQLAFEIVDMEMQDSWPAKR